MSFHLFHINEIYSNASGTVQYIEFIGEIDNQHLWSGHSIVASGGGAPRTFNITTNLPSSETLGKTVLVATQGFANLGSMPPDYIVPNNFLSTGSGSVSFPGMDQLSYTMLAQPGGVNSLNSSLVAAFNTPRNFAGTSLSILGNPVVGTTGNDNLVGTAGRDYVAGAAGDDTLAGGADNDTLHGGLGSDTANYASATAAVTVNLLFSVPRPTGGAGIDTLFNIENVTGSAFNDTLTGNIVNNILTGGAGNDLLNGGAGIDTASYFNSTAAVRVNLTLAGQQNTLGAGLDTLSGMENLTGGTGNDTLTGSTINNVLNGGNGNDAITGLQGNDILNGGNGGDTLGGGLGNDALSGGAGVDTASYATATVAVSVHLALTAAQNTLGAGNDTLSSIERLTGSSFNDTLRGNTQANTLSGGNGNDLLVGGNGNDTLVGGNGNDMLRGEAGADALTGNAGADHFDFDIVGHTGTTEATRDRILDFVRAQGDKVDIAGLDANLALAGNQVFTFIGAAAFSGVNATGQVRFDAVNHLVLGSNDADSAAEFSILMTGIGSMLAADFVL